MEAVFDADCDLPDGFDLAPQHQFSNRRGQTEPTAFRSAKSVGRVNSTSLPVTRHIRLCRIRQSGYGGCCSGPAWCAVVGRLDSAPRLNVDAGLLSSGFVCWLRSAAAAPVTLVGGDETRVPIRTGQLPIGARSVSNDYPRLPAAHVAVASPEAQLPY